MYPLRLQQNKQNSILSTVYWTTTPGRCCSDAIAIRSSECLARKPGPTGDSRPCRYRRRRPSLPRLLLVTYNDRVCHTRKKEKKKHRSAYARKASSGASNMHGTSSVIARPIKDIVTARLGNDTPATSTALLPRRNGQPQLPAHPRQTTASRTTSEKQWERSP